MAAGLIWLVLLVCVPIAAARDGEERLASRYYILNNNELHVDVSEMKYGEFTRLAHNVMITHPIDLIYIYRKGEVIDVSPHGLYSVVKVQVAPYDENEESDTSSPGSSVVLERFCPREGAREYNFLICSFKKAVHQEELLSFLQEQQGRLETVGVLITLPKDEGMDTLIHIIKTISAHVKIEGTLLGL